MKILFSNRLASVVGGMSKGTKRASKRWAKHLLYGGFWHSPQSVSVGIGKLASCRANTNNTLDTCLGLAFERADEEFFKQAALEYVKLAAGVGHDLLGGLFGGGNEF